LYHVKITRTLCVLLFLSLANILVLPFLILWSLIVGNPDFMYGMAMKALAMANRLGGIRVSVEGAENIPAGAAIFVANHASNVDPPLLAWAIPRRIAILVKKELFRLPIFATSMRVASFIPVDRGSKEAIQSIDAAVKVLQSGVSLLIFPEGTRSPDGRLRRFRKGAFTIAVRSGVPIVPTSMAGTQKIMRKGERLLRPGAVTVRFGPPIDPSRYEMNERLELVSVVEKAVAAALPRDQQPE
jgi:1-acyl-sn-glycerol-3-phosphate acyltransferase